MRLLILAAAALAATSAMAATDIKLGKEQCKVGPRTAEGGESPASKRLGELPPGQLLLAVYREENGCPKPVIVRQNVGSQPRR
jgi:hypothetical protein